MFVLENVNVAYQATPVLRDISLRIENGEKVVLIGPSGAGKTTLLNKLHQLEPRQAAFIHQDFALVGQLAVFHNVLMGRLDRHPVLYNVANLVKPIKKEVDQVRAVLASLGMEEKIFVRVAQLSGGQQQRVAVARALYRESDILLGDEPVSSIDPHQAGSVLELLKQSAQTVVLSLHSVGQALACYERAIGLRQGRILFDLPSTEIRQDMLNELYQPC